MGDKEVPRVDGGALLHPEKVAALVFGLPFYRFDSAIKCCICSR